MDRFGHNIRADVRKQGAEVSDLPILCETCLGENPYVRLLREENGKECKICQNPFTHFRWKPGQSGRYKQTIICNGCAKLKNVCQTCLFDLDYNLPVQVRDKLLDSAITLPENEVNRNFFLEQAEKNMETAASCEKMNRPNIDLKKLRRVDPYFKRNMARVCSFWRKNMCNRGDECPYLHKEIHLDKSLSNQNIKSRYMGENDVLAEKILSKIKKKEEEETVEEFEGSYKENTICLTGAGSNICELNIRDRFSKYGNIIHIKKKPTNSKVYITFGNSTAARNAYVEHIDGFRMNGYLIYVTLESEENVKMYKPPNKNMKDAYVNLLSDDLVPFKIIKHQNSKNSNYNNNNVYNSKINYKKYSNMNVNKNRNMNINTNMNRNMNINTKMNMNTNMNANVNTNMNTNKSMNMNMNRSMNNQHMISPTLPSPPPPPPPPSEKTDLPQTIPSVPEEKK